MQNALISLIALAAANFAYQAVKGKDWKVARERTFFQAVAIAVLMFGMGN
jgi:hypothetical protein